MDGDGTGRRSLSPTAWLFGLLGALALAGVVVGTVLLVRGPQVPAYADTAVQSDVRSAAERFASAVNTYDVTDLDPYVERVTPLLTDELAEQFEASTRDLLSAFAETKVKAQGEVRQVGIESLDGDSAEVLAAIDVTTTPANVQYGQPRLRWRISLVLTDGEWLVDTFEQVGASALPGAQDVPATPAPTEDPDPTDQPDPTEEAP
ncbi:Mce-associated membrane protein [Mumia flava]|uniref:Mce-associated membrane protein n=1 Tax=Mumia flava TaxID=1348852 RepID=A0A0B2BMS9_9ACTN|nr:hypothetical protein [Mumia flava]PJJ58300.1 Mce-associated membrane protein [Mumia flava]